MDEIDRKLLQLLQKNGRISLKSMADHTYLSSPAVSARIARMENAGIITGYHASVDPIKLGCQIMAFVSTAVRAADQPEFFERLRNYSNILECSCVTGEYSVILKAAFAGTEELDAFVREVGHFGNTKVQVVLSTPVSEKNHSFAAAGEEKMKQLRPA